MPLKVFDFILRVPSFLGRTFNTCTRMQRRVNRRHNSLTVDVVKRPGLDS